MDRDGRAGIEFGVTGVPETYLIGKGGQVLAKHTGPLSPDDAMKLAFLFREANEKFAADYPAAVGSHMTNTDSSQFMDLVPAISLRENERGMQIGAGWDPHWHQPTDRYATFSDKDFRLGLNAAQTTLGAVARLAGAALKK